MIIFTPNKINGEIYNNLPTGVLYPALQNKSNLKNSLNGLKIQVNFEN